jgi:DNA modification methylase
VVKQAPLYEYIAQPLRSLALPIESLVPDPANARTHDEKNLASIKASLSRFGQRLPIVVQKQGMIVRAGNGRLLAARELGWTHMAAVVVDESEVEATAFAIADNRSAELAEWDDEALAKLLQALPDDAFAATGFSDGDLNDLLDTLAPAGVTQDEPPEPPEAPVSRAGDLWLLGEHRLLCGDSCKPEDVHRLMGGERADIVWTDPPYGIAVVGGARTMSQEERIALGGKTIQNDEIDPEKLGTLLRGSLGLALEYSRPGAPWYVAGPGGMNAAVFLTVLQELEVGRHILIWVKDRFVIGRCDFHYRHEFIFYGWAPGAGRTPVEERDLDTVWEFERPARSELHPTMKPVALVAKALEVSSHRGDLVYEPFGGSGTTLVAAEQLKRRCCACELDGRYADVIVRRWQGLTGGTATLDRDGRSFGEVEAERLKEKAPEAGAGEEAA